MIGPLIQPPYLDPEPELVYQFDVGTPIIIDLRQPVDPQGSQLAVDVDLGEIGVYLEHVGTFV